MTPDLPHLEDDVAFRVVLSSDDIPDEMPTDDFEATADTILETASVLPNSEIQEDQYGHVVCTVSTGDARRYDNIVERIRELVAHYEQLCRRRDRAESGDVPSEINWPDFDDAVEDATGD
jgi:hypothetical protein